MKLRLGVDIDETITNENPFKSIQPAQLKTHSHILEKAILNCTLKSGAEVLRNTPHDIILITGRQEQFRNVTELWLDLNNIPFDELIMCENDYYLQVFDHELYIKYKISAYQSNNIHYAFEDDEKLVELLNTLGITAKHVTTDFKEVYETIFIKGQLK